MLTLDLHSFTLQMQIKPLVTTTTQYHGILLVPWTLIMTIKNFATTFQITLIRVLLLLVNLRLGLQF